MASVSAQSTISPDSVCAGANGKAYKVVGTPGSTFSWVISGGTKVSGGTTDSIRVNWSATPGTGYVKVVEFNVIGCPGDTIDLTVVRLVPPFAVISGTDSICINSATVLNPLKIAFTGGLGPWNLTYSEDGSSVAVNTNLNPYTFNSKVYSSAGVKNYSMLTITDRFGCSGSGSGSASVTVFGKPSTSAISHY